MTDVLRASATSVAPPRTFQLVAIAASAGGLAALTAVLSRLPATFPLPVAVVQHVDPARDSVIADILSRRTPLAVKQGADKERHNRSCETSKECPIHQSLRSS